MKFVITRRLILLSTLCASASPVPAQDSQQPPVQMLVPGFVVEQLPVELNNINNIRYRHDGTLVALGYDGNVHLLTDTDGDGVEDSSRVFWENKGQLRDPIGMALTPPGYRHGNGVFVASHGRCSLIVDTDGDDRADDTRIIAEGWRELPNGLDAIGVAFDARDGSLFLGLGAADYTNPYEVDGQDAAGYRTTDERGTIVRISPDFESREIVCSGIRFPVGLAFDSHGELFCTDQEGATWLANGNPFDELLHIQKGRHYGFPPRHPRHLPDVIDEPSVFDYGPQHQSTCGLFFNRSVHGGPVFGPQSWSDDALVCGYSRGKLFRTKLVKTAAGYTAKTQLIACLNMLTADACVAPGGSLTVAVHSGGPDWGSGPDGLGKLYKVTYVERELPQPVIAFPSGPRALCIAFDRPLGALDLDELAKKTSITYGKYVRAGDRFESVRPGYAVVAQQLATPRYSLRVQGAKIGPDGRTLILATAPHPETSHYAVTLPGFPAAKNRAESEPGLKQHDEIDLDYDLSGVTARWEGRSGEAAWSGWLPHVDLAVARSFTSGSAEHDRLWKHLESAGKLSLGTSLDLTHMLRPAVQPSSQISYEWPAETVTLTLGSSGALDVKCEGAQIEKKIEESGSQVVTVTVQPVRDKLLPIEIILTSDGGRADLSMAFHTAEDGRPRTLALRRLIVPWAAATSPVTTESAPREIAELRGGNWLRGRELFFSEKSLCGKCHAIRGRGGKTGPDLSNLAHRDYPSVLRDITEPSFAINPEFITFKVVLDDGRVLEGPIRTIDGQAHIGDSKGQVTVFEPEAVDSLKASKLSIMPDQAAKELSPVQMKDLMTYLLKRPPRMPQYGEYAPPPPRRQSEVEAVLRGAPAEPPQAQPMHVVLVAGKQDHPTGQHDYPAWQNVWRELLAMSAGTTVSTAMQWPAADDFAKADVIVFYQRGDWTPQRAKEIDAYLARGGGLVYIHWAVDGRADAAGFAQRIGMAWDGETAKYRHGAIDLKFHGDDHPIARNFEKLHLFDESYWRLTGDPNGIRLLASGNEEGEPQPLFWTFEPGQGRVFVSILGHFAWTFDDPLFRVLLLRGIAWAARQPVDRFNELVTAGARIID